MKEKYDHLCALKEQIEAFPFQEYIIKPLFAELDKLKNAYDCTSLRELALIKGKKQGILFLIDILKGIDTEIKNIKYDLDEVDS